MKNAGTVLAVVFAALTGLGGYLVGKGSSRDGVDAESEIAGSKSEVAESAATKAVARGGDVQPNLRGYELSQNPSMGLETLLEELRQSPMAQMDFEALFGIWDMIQYLDGYELQALMAELEEMGGGQEMMAVRMMLLNRWAAKDGPAAMESVFEGEKGMMQVVGAMGAMMGWMRSDPEQAYSWFQENGDRLGGGAMGMGKEQIEAMYFANKAKKDFDGTMAELDGMDSKIQKAVIQQLSQTAVMDEDKRNELLDYLKAKEDKSLLAEARTNIVNQMAWHDPQGAIAFIESEQTDPETKQSLLDNATRMWSHSDPKGAVEYFGEEFRGQEDAGEKIAESFGNWAAQDEAGAAAWLSEQPDEFKTDSVFLRAGQSLLNSSEYERSAEWYGQILDEDQRKTNFQILYNRWGGSDQEAADAWKSELPPEDLALFEAPSAEEQFEAPVEEEN